MFTGMTVEEVWTLIGVWAFFAAIIGFIAGARGRSQVNWFFLAFFISPLLAFVVLALMPNLKTRASPVAEPTPPCPRCGVPRVKGQRYCAGCGLDLWAEYDARAAR